MSKTDTRKDAGIVVAATSWDYEDVNTDFSVSTLGGATAFNSNTISKHLQAEQDLLSRVKGAGESRGTQITVPSTFDTSHFLHPRSHEAHFKFNGSSALIYFSSKAESSPVIDFNSSASGERSTTALEMVNALLGKTHDLVEKIANEPIKIPDYLLVKNLNPIVELAFKHVSPTDIKTHIYQGLAEIDGQKYDIEIKRVGKDVALAKTVQAWLANPDQAHPDKPPRYIGSKNFGTREGAIAHLSLYKTFIEAKALFRHELRVLDPELAPAIDTLISKKLVPSELIPAKKSEKKEMEFTAIQKLDAPFTKKLIRHNGKLRKNLVLIA